MRKSIIVLSSLSIVAVLLLAGCPKSNTPPPAQVTPPPSSSDNGTASSAPQGSSGGYSGGSSSATPGGSTGSTGGTSSSPGGTSSRPGSVSGNTGRATPAGYSPPASSSSGPSYSTYTSKEGKYSIEIPRGWQRMLNGTEVTFSNSSGTSGIRIALSKADSPPTITSVTADQVPVLKKLASGVKIDSVKSMQLDNGLTAVYVQFSADSKPDPATKKTIRLNEVAYFYYAQGMLAMVTEWSPAGASSASQWRRVADSFKWNK